MIPHITKNKKDLKTFILTARKLWFLLPWKKKRNASTKLTTCHQQIIQKPRNILQTAAL